MSDVSVQMGVSGVSQFKSQMAQAQASVKNIDAALKLNEKQYKATGDAETYMQNKTTQLNSKLQAQQNAVKSAQAALQQMRDNGVDPLSVSYQKMETALLNAQSAVLDTQASINELGSESVEAAGQADQLVNTLSGLNKKISVDNVVKGITSITTGLEKAAKKAIELGNSIWDNITDGAKWADDVATQAMMLDMDVEDYQRYKRVFDTVGEMSVSAWMSAKRKVQQAINAPSNEQTNILSILGINTHEMRMGKEGLVQGAARPFEDVLWDIGETLIERVESGKMTQDLADTYANAIFGKSFSEFKPLFHMGRTAFQEALENQTVVSKKAVEANADLNDSLKKLQDEFNNLEQEVLAGLAPALQKVADSLTGMLTKLIEYVQSPEGQEALERMGKAVEGIFSDITSIDPQDVVQGFADVFNGIIDGLQWLDEHGEGLVTVMGVIVAGWAALKITGGALQILQMINGLRELKNTKSINLPNINGGQNGTGTPTGTQTVTTQTVTNATVTNESVTNETVTNATITNETISAANIATATTTTETVTTMYVQNMIGGNGMPGSNPTTPYQTGGGGNDGFNGIYLNPGTGSSGYIGGGGGGDLNLNGVDNVNLPGGSQLNLPPGTDTTINMPQGSEPIKLGPGDYSIDGAGFDSGAGAGAGAGAAAAAKKGLGAILGSTAAKVAGGVAAFLTVLLTPADTANDEKDWPKLMQEARSQGFTAAVNELENGWNVQFDEEAKAALVQWAYDRFLAENPGDLTDELIEQLIGMGYERKKEKTLEVTPRQREELEQLWDYYREEGPLASSDWEYLMREFTFKDSQELIDLFWQKINQTGFTGEDLPDDWFEVPAELKLPEDEGEKLAEQVGVVTIPARMSMQEGDADGSYANGLPFVPFDGYMAMLHRGERVMTARENRNYTYNNNTYFGNVNLNNGLEIEQLTESISRHNRRKQSGYGG